MVHGALLDGHTVMSPTFISVLVVTVMSPMTVLCSYLSWPSFSVTDDRGLIIVQLGCVIHSSSMSS